MVPYVNRRQLLMDPESSHETLLRSHKPISGILKLLAALLSFLQSCRSNQSEKQNFVPINYEFCNPIPSCSTLVRDSQLKLFKKLVIGRCQCERGK